MDTLDRKYLCEKLDVMFDILNCASKLNVAFGFVLKNVEDRSFSYYYAHDKNILLERPTLLAATEDLTKVNILEVTPTSSHRVQENETTQNGSFTS